MTTHRPHMLIAEDDADIRDVVSHFAKRAGYEVTVCTNGREALDLLETTTADLAMVDLHMPEVGGLDVLRAIRAAVPGCQTIVMTGFESVPTAVEAIKLGALDYMVKPLDFERLGQLLQQVREEIARRRKLLTVDGETAERLQLEGLIGRSAVMQELFSLVRRLAPHVRTVLITGETGTGKELVARALHRLGPRRNARFVVLNCSAVVETLFESELFGHVRGAFTGATENKPGLFDAADGGTLFLDEVGELPLTVQAKLLRVLESGEVHRVGSLSPRTVNVHVIAATNRNPQAEIAAGRFRSDLFYRLSVVEISLPPLRDRREDIPYLTAAFMRECATRLSKPLAGVTTGAERLLVSHPWAGNVRELRNVLERACILADGDLITEREFVKALPAAAPPRSVADAIAAAPDAGLLEAVERQHIEDALHKTGGNKKAAARLLGLSRRTLYRRLANRKAED
jgi:two-component system response regulator HydG